MLRVYTSNMYSYTTAVRDSVIELFEIYIVAPFLNALRVYYYVYLYSLRIITYIYTL